MRVLVLAIVVLLAACGEGKKPVPPPAALTADAIAHFCGMAVADHPGPKAQIFVAGQDKPVWFTSVHDAVAFTLLPEEPKDIRAFYVTDMASAPSWDHPEQGRWIDAKTAFYVIGSDTAGGMGTPEAVPFATRAAADGFAQGHGGQVVALDAIPRDYILGTAPGGGSP
jgi:copper chaperone NosL